MFRVLVLLTIVTCGIRTLFADTKEPPLDIGSRQELFVDNYLLDKLTGLGLKLNPPRDEGIVFRFDQSWEGRWGSYCTIIKDGNRFRLYYRGWPEAGDRGVKKVQVVTCLAESKDGIKWTRPTLDLFEVNGTRRNNVVLDGPFEVTENFTPFLDARPDVSANERYKGLGGQKQTGLMAYTSADGVRWRLLQAQPILPTDRFYRPNTLNVFDSQNVAFWSSIEKQYVCYYRVFKDDVRRIARTTSSDFINWSDPTLMEYRCPHGNSPLEHLYTNQTQPYFRAPHIYIATPARLVFNRQVVTPEEARSISQHPGYLGEVSDSLLLTTRDYIAYDRTFLEAHLRPGIGPENWVSRTNYPALNIVQTGPQEMSLYVNQNYGQPTDHLRRYSLPLDRFASLHADYQEGEGLTKLFRFNGSHLLINFSTSAVGDIRVEIQDENGRAIPGFMLEECQPMIGNEIEKIVRWAKGDKVSSLSGKIVRLRIVMKDSDLYGLSFK